MHRCQILPETGFDHGCIKARITGMDRVELRGASPCPFISSRSDAYYPTQQRQWKTALCSYCRVHVWYGLHGARRCEYTFKRTKSASACISTYNLECGGIGRLYYEVLLVKWHRRRGIREMHLWLDLGFQAVRYMASRANSNTGECCDIGRNITQKKRKGCKSIGLDIWKEAIPIPP